MRNICESPINVVNDNKPKVLSGLNQKVSQGSPLLSCATCDSPGEQADATSSQSDHAEHGKPVFLLIVIRGRELQGVPKGMRVWDVGESESRIVTMRTAAMPQPERAQTSDRWRITGKMRKGFAAGSTDRHRASGPTGDGAADGKP